MQAQRELQERQKQCIEAERKVGLLKQRLQQTEARGRQYNTEGRRYGLCLCFPPFSPLFLFVIATKPYVQLTFFPQRLQHPSKNSPDFYFKGWEKWVGLANTGLYAPIRGVKNQVRNKNKYKNKTNVQKPPSSPTVRRSPRPSFLD